MGNQPDTNMFGNWGPSASSTSTSYNTLSGEIMKKLGATKIACVANNIPGGIADCTSSQQGVKHLGLTDQYTDTTATLAQADFSAIALGVKNSGANGLLAELGPEQNAALLIALAQDGFHPKGLFLSASYGQNVLSDPQLLSAVKTTGATLGSYFTPIQANTAGTKAFAAALKKYSGVTGVPSFQNYEGYTSGLLAIKALQVGGKNPTNKSMIAGMQKVTGDTLGGLTVPLSWPLSKFGKGPQALGPNACNYLTKIVNGKYALVTKTWVCGQQIG